MQLQLHSFGKHLPRFTRLLHRDSVREPTDGYHGYPHRYVRSMSSMNILIVTTITIIFFFLLLLFAGLRGVLVEGSAAELRPRSVRSARPAGSLSALHPDSQRPPSLPPPCFGGLGSASPFRSMSAEDGSNLGEIVLPRATSEAGRPALGRAARRV